MFKKLLGVILGCILLFSISAYAQGDGAVANILFSPESGRVTVSGKSEGSSVTVMIYKKGAVLSDGNLPIDFEVIRVYDGAFEGVLDISDIAEKTTYTVKVKSEDGVWEDDFVYFNTDEADTLLSGISKKSRTEFMSFLKDNATSLGIDKENEFYNENEDNILSILYAFKEEIDDSVSFYNAYNIAFAAALLNDGQCEASLQKYGEVIGVDYENDYKESKVLSEEAKEELLSLLEAEDFSESLKDKSFLTIYKELSALAAVKKAESSAQLQKIIEEDFEDLFSDFKGGNAKIYSKMMNCDFDTFEDIEANFKKCKKSVSDGGGSTSSGGGSSFGGTYSSSQTVSNYVQEEEKVSEDGKTETEVKEVSFSDVNEGDWYYESITKLSQRGIVSGYEDGKYKPHKTVTRAEFAKLAYTAFEDRFTKVEKIEGRVTKVACVGDSLTQGLIGDDGVYTKEVAYADKLSEILGDDFEVKNFGRSSHGILENHKYPYLSTDEYKASLQYVPDVLITMFGTNDIKTDYWAQAKEIYGERYKYFINTYREVNPDVQIIVVLPPAFYVDDAARPIENLIEGIEIISGVAEEEDCVTVDLYSEFEGGEFYFPDKLHYNMQGAKKAAEAISRALSGGDEATFSDVGDEWFAPYVTSAASAGLIKGSEGKFMPDGEIKREDAAVIIYRALSLFGKTMASTPFYTDNIDIAPYAFTAIGGLSKYKIVQGADGMFSPKASITRAEAAQLIYNALSYMEG